MNGLTRVLVADLQPGDPARPSRAGQPFTVAAIASQHGAWAVRGVDGITRHYASTARVWRSDLCAGQTALFDPQEAAHA